MDLRAQTPIVVFLVVEDDRHMNEAIARSLEQAFLNVSVARALTYRDALVQIEAGMPDLITLDLSLGDRRHGGVELLRDLRVLGQAMPVFVYSGVPDATLVKVCFSLWSGDNRYLDFFSKPEPVSTLVRAIAERLGERVVRSEYF